MITIKGSIADIARAEAEVSAKLRAAYETDLQAMAPQSVMFPGLHPAAMMSTAGLGPGQQYGRQAGYQGGRPPAPHTPTETSYLYIPNSAVGAIIGDRMHYSECLPALMIQTVQERKAATSETSSSFLGPL